MNLKEAYDNEIDNSEKKDIIFTGGEKPVICEGLINPESVYYVNRFLGAGFRIDKETMYKVINSFEENFENGTDANKKDLIFTLTVLQSTVDSFFGNKNDASLRKHKYMVNGEMDLCEFEGTGCGACSEKAALAHQLMTLLYKTEKTKFKSYIANSLSCSERRPEQNLHTFLLLKSQDRNFLYDIQNPLTIEDKERGQKFAVIGIYELSDDTMEKFENGEVIQPTSLYKEKFGANIEVIDGKFYYGNGPVKINEEVKREDDSEGPDGH